MQMELLKPLREDGGGGWESHLCWKWVEEVVLWHLEIFSKISTFSLHASLKLGPLLTQKALQLKFRYEKYRLPSEVVPWDRPRRLHWGQEGDRTRE